MNVKKDVRTWTRKFGYELRDANYIPQSHERKIYEYYLKKTDPIRTIFDVGANVGQTALAFHESFPDARIYSFEPFAQVYRVLVAGTSHLPAVSCQPVALGDAETTMTVASESMDQSDINSLLDDKQKELEKRGVTEVESIVVRTGEGFCAEHEISRVDILKIDTEGYELPVLRGFGTFLEANVRAILCEFCLLENKARQTSLIRLQEFLQPKGFELASLYDVRHEADGAFHYGNALFVHADHLNPDRRW